MHSKPESHKQSPSLTNAISIRNCSKVTDEVRTAEFRKAEKEDREALKATKYLPSKAREDLAEEQGLHLERLLKLNRNLNVVYLLKDDLKRLWDCRDRREATSLT